MIARPDWIQPDDGDADKKPKQDPKDLPTLQEILGTFKPISLPAAGLDKDAIKNFKTISEMLHGYLPEDMKTPCFCPDCLMTIYSFC
jgi:hypothetical protein